MSKREEPKKFPWLPLLLLVASIVVFWVVPILQRNQPMQIETTPVRAR